VSRSAVQRATAVRNVDPELHDQVKAGELSLEDARRAIASNGECDLHGNGETDGDSTHGGSEIASEEFIIRQFKLFIKKVNKYHGMTSTKIRSCIRTYLDRRT
jgi:hypothetical protein